MNDAPHALPPPPPAPHESRLHRFVSSFGHLVGTMIEMVFTRLELIVVEFQEWIESLIGIFFWGMVMIFAAAVFLLLGSFTLIFVFWETHRVLVAALETGAFALLMVGAMVMMKRRLSVHGALLVTTLAEFAKDRELFKRPPIPDGPPVSPVSPMPHAVPSHASAQAPPL